MKILIADDEGINRTLLQLMLQEQGYHDCYEAHDGEHALQMAESVEPDIVLLDVIMPKMDGFEVAKQLKKKAGDTYLPIIFITALDDQDSLAKCLEVGGDDFVAKPFDKVVLAAKIRAHWRTRSFSIKTQQQNQELTFYRNAVEREHNIIEHIFSNALGINSEVDEYVEYRLTPASNFNGDLFLAEPSPSGGMYLLLGDFTGHGLASAIGALPVSKAFLAMVAKGLSVAEMAQTINQTLLSLLPGDMFFAAAIIEISHEGDYITVWNGGMPHLILLSKSGRIRKRLESLHMALGVLDDHDFEDDVEHFEAQPDDRLFGYSDGVIELIDKSGNMLGSEGLEEWLLAEPDISVSDLVGKIEDFRGAAEQLDDFTLVHFRCQKLANFTAINSLPEVPFCIDINLQGRQLVESDPVQEMITMIGSQNGLQGLRSDLFTVLSELYNNALDHGVLKLESELKASEDGFFEYFEQREQKLAELTDGYVMLRAAYHPLSQELQIAVHDSGDGFDYQNLPKAKNDDPFGRGIYLIKDLCDQVTYTDGGRCATVVFRF